MGPSSQNNNFRKKCVHHIRLEIHKKPNKKILEIFTRIFSRKIITVILHHYVYGYGTYGMVKPLRRRGVTIS